MCQNYSSGSQVLRPAGPTGDGRRRGDTDSFTSWYTLGRQNRTDTVAVCKLREQRELRKVGAVAL